MKIIIFAVIFSFTSIPLFSQAANVEKGNEYYSKAMQFYESKNYDSLIYYMNAALELRKDHPYILYNLAAGYALNGDKSEALHILHKIADMKLYFDVQKDSDFISLMNADSFKKLQGKFEANSLSVLNSTTAFRLKEKGLLTEGIAYDKRTKEFFISSVHKRKILAYKKDGNIKDFSSDKDSLPGIFGIHTDERHRTLWAAGATVKNMSGYDKDMKGMSNLYQFDLDSGKLLAVFQPPERDTDHMFGDLTVDSSGNVYVSDSRFNMIYRLPYKGNNLETFVTPGYFISLQGLALNRNDSILYAADYSQGIFKINMKDKSADLLRNETGTTLLGIDGLYFYKGSLIAIQNGVNPQRVLLLDLNHDITSVSGYEILESNNPLFDEPTLGVISGNEFYFIANSQWRRFNKDGTIFPDENLEYPLILKIKLDAAK